MPITLPSAQPRPAGRNGATGLRVKVFADGASTEQILSLADDALVAGFTTNPTLMRASGVTDYRAFADELLHRVRRKPISFEVGADEAEEMYYQAREIASWGANVYVKVPVTNTRGESMIPVAGRLSQEDVQVNVTAVFTPAQVAEAVAALEGGAPSIVSVFAGRIADTGRDPVPLMKAAVRAAARVPSVEVLWASSREVLNLYQAEAAGCQIITLTPDLLAKVRLRRKGLLDYSLETVRMFHADAKAIGEIFPRERTKKAA